jgi:hypothetical protein
MASQTNNFILLEKDISSPLRGQQRSIDAADDIILSPASVAIQPSGDMSLVSTSGVIDIGNNASSTGAINIAGSSATGARSINIGTGGTGAKVVSIGDVTVAGSTINILAGTTGGINIGAASVATPVYIATNTTAGTVLIGTGTATQTLSIASGAGVKTLTLGSLTTTSTTTIQAGTSGLSLTTASTGAINIGNDSATGNITIGNGTGIRTIFIGNAASGAKAIVIGNSTANGSTVNILGALAGGVNIATSTTNCPVNIATASTAGTVSIGTGSAMHTLAFGTGAGNKTVSVGSISGTSATTVQAGTGAMTFTAGGIFDVNATGAVTIDSSGGAISIGADTVSQNLNIGTGGDRYIAIGATNNTSRIGLRMGRRGVQLEPSATYGARGLGYAVTNRSGSAVTDGALLAFQVSPAADQLNPQVVLASAASGAAASVRQVNAIFTPSFSVANGSDGAACTIPGSIVPVQFASAPVGSADIGKPVYLSTTAGKATLTAPSASGQRVFQVGILARGTADASSNWYVQFMPQFIADIP